MKRNYTSLILALALSLSSMPVFSQFLNFLPGKTNYINSNVTADSSGLTFYYMWQDSTLALHRAFVYTNDDGEIQSVKRLGTYTRGYKNLSDGTVILSGGGSNSSGNRFAILQKDNADGSLAWRKHFKSTGADISVSNLMESGDNIIATMSRSSFISNTYVSKNSVMAINKSTGAQVWIKHFGNAGFTTDYRFDRVITAQNGDIIALADIRGSANAQANGMMLTRITPQGTIVFSKYYNFIETHTQISVNGLIEAEDGSIIFGGRLMTDQISMIGNSMWLGKTDAAGNAITQKVYSLGPNTGELLFGLETKANRTYAHVVVISTFLTVSRSIWIGELNTQTLSFTASSALDLSANNGDPYGNVSNSLAITSTGKPVLSAGASCPELGKSQPLMIQFSSNLETNCSDLDIDQPISDSVTAYPNTDYTPVGSFSVTIADDTTTLELIFLANFDVQDRCEGCTSTLSLKSEKAFTDFTVYPNPSNGKFLIESAEEGEFSILNSAGAIVYSAKLKHDKTPVELDGIAPGIYFLHLRGKSSAKKIVITD